MWLHRMCHFLEIFREILVLIVNSWGEKHYFLLASIIKVMFVYSDAIFLLFEYIHCYCIYNYRYCIYVSELIRFLQTNSLFYVDLP